jgi:poly(3-hydroxybutyrate) depolymerase
MIFQKAVDWALRHDEFFDERQVTFATTLLEQRKARVEQLAADHMAWLSATGLVVRGYRSKLDGSVQPYGLVLPADCRPHQTEARPLLIWLLGRNDKRTELAFLAEREKAAPPFSPAGAIVLVPYGRFCNATKFAGEVDVFEAMEAVRAEYTIDPNRIAVAGFSMGGASVWHLVAHHAGLWCAASPGAGFAETAIYTKAFKPGQEPPPSWEQMLWRYYDATACAGNLFNCPTIAYSGELDPQKLSADLMEEAMAAEGLKLERIIGPATGHQYQPDAQKELAARLDTLIKQGRDPKPSEVRLTTYTLRYPEIAWARIEGMGQHWQRADVRAQLQSPETLLAQVTNVTALKFSLAGLRALQINGERLTIPANTPEVFVHRSGDHWHLGRPRAKLAKAPGLTGPIDDAFMEPFVFVVPSQPALHEKTGAWVTNELAQATKMWRDIFRGDVPILMDTNVTAAELSTKNVVLWGDPSSNQLLAKILDGLPLKWTAERLEVRGERYSAQDHMPILIYPNPANPHHYVVLNSGIDFRQDAYGTNAKQTPKLPDWAVVDLNTPPGPRWPGKIVAAGFFDEEWQ